MNGPWQIPRSWVWVESHQIAEIVGGGTPRTDDPTNFEGGDVPWVTPADLSGYKDKYISRGARNITRKGLGNSGASLMPKGTVLFSSRAPIGYVAIAANPLSTNQGFKSFVLRPSIKPDYAYYYLQRAKDLAVELSSGTTFREISGAKAALIPFPVAPIAEQERVVSEIEKQFTRLDAAVVALKRVRANLKRYRAAILKAAYEGRLVASTSESSFTAGLVSPVKDLISEPLANGRSPSSATSGAKILRLTSMQGNFLDFSEFRFGDLDDLNRNNLRVQEGDIFVARGSGSVHLVGRASLARALPSDYIAFPDTMIRIRLNPVVVEPLYFIYLWNSAVVRSQIEGIARTTAGIHKISQRDIENITLPLVPLVDQRKVIRVLEEKFSIIDAVENTTALDSTRAEHLRQAILKNAFEGKLVPQEPSDEPASILLSRTASESSAEISSRIHIPERKGGAQPMSRNKGTKRIPIVEALSHNKSGMSPEDLLTATGHGPDSIDDFYAELKSQVDAGLVKETRSGDKIAIRALQK